MVSIAPARRGRQIAIRLEAVQHLFEAPARDPLAKSPLRLCCGVDELLNELGARRLDTVTGAVLVLPVGEVGPGLDEQLRHALRAYCQLRLRETDNELRAVRQDARRAVGVGASLFVGGIVVSTVVTQSSAPDLVQILGDGLAVVVAWIGAWYPLDTLIFYTRPYRRTKKVLQALSRIEVTVETAS